MISTEGLAEIGSALGSLKTASDIVKTFAGLRTDTERDSKLVELQGQIIAAQTSAISANAAQMALIDEVRNLEKHIAGMEAWETEKQRYELKKVSYWGATAYVVKPDMRGSEPPHCICGCMLRQREKGQTPARYTKRYGSPSSLGVPGMRYDLSDRHPASRV